MLWNVEGGKSRNGEIIAWYRLGSWEAAAPDTGVSWHLVTKLKWFLLGTPAEGLQGGFQYLVGMMWLIHKNSFLPLFLCGSKLAFPAGKCGLISVYLLCRERMARCAWLWCQTCSGPSGRGFFRELRNKITLVGVERPQLCAGEEQWCVLCVAPGIEGNLLGQIKAFSLSSLRTVSVTTCAATWQRWHIGLWKGEGHLTGVQINWGMLFLMIPAFSDSEIVRDTGDLCRKGEEVWCVRDVLKGGRWQCQGQLCLKLEFFIESYFHIILVIWLAYFFLYSSHNLWCVFKVQSNHLFRDFVPIFPSQILICGENC